MTDKKSLQGVKEIAQLTGVSIGTVDRVLHNRPGVAKKTKEKVLAILKEYNYTPNLIGRSLSRKKSLELAALIPKSSPESAYWDAPLEGLKKAQHDLEKYQVQIRYYLFDQNDRQSFVDQVEELKKTEIEGLILAPTFLKESTSLCQYCDEKGILYSLINSDLKDVNNIAYYGPDLFQTGRVAANLIELISKVDDNLLVLHVSKEMEEDHHILRKEEGLMDYFQKSKLNKEISRLWINETSYSFIADKLDQEFKRNVPKVIFVSNSRVSTVAQYLENKQIQDIKLIGFDFLPDHIKFLNTGVIDFLICHKPIEQAVQAVNALFNKIVLHKEPQKINFMPLDIISKENYIYYEN